MNKWIRRLWLSLLIGALLYRFVHPPRRTNASFWAHQPVEWDTGDTPTNEINSNTITAIDASCASPMLVTISKLPLFNLTIPEEMRFQVFTASQVESTTHYASIYAFLRENFSSYLRLKEDVLAHHITHERAVNIGLYHGKTLVGFIHGRPIQIMFHSNPYDIYYVEYLCVHDDYRSRNLASLMISRYIQEMERVTGRDDLWFLFKKDGQRHPFVSFFLSEYQYLELESCKTSHVFASGTDTESTMTTASAITDAETKRTIYDSWVKYSSSFQFHRNMSFDEFATPVTHMWICGLDNIAIVGKSSELYDPSRDTHDAVIDIEYIIPLTPRESTSESTQESSIEESGTTTTEEESRTTTTEEEPTDTPVDTPNDTSVTPSEIAPSESSVSIESIEKTFPWALSDLVVYLKQQGYMYITVNRIGYHEEILRSVEPTFQWKIANQFQYYAYNFKCPKMNKEDFYFTIN